MDNDETVNPRVQEIQEVATKALIVYQKYPHLTTGYYCTEETEQPPEYDCRTPTEEEIRKAMQHFSWVMQQFVEAFCKWLNTLNPAIEQIQKELDELAASKDLLQKHTWDKTRRRAQNRARSPVLRRYWINYRARDKLVCKSLKSARMRKHGGNGNGKG